LVSGSSANLPSPWLYDRDGGDGKEGVKIPVIAVGKLGYPEVAERVLQEGKADFIALGRALLADPEWPNKVKENRFEDICPCIGDHEGCMERAMRRKYVSCSVTPSTGMEKEFTLYKAKKKKSVLVIGAGPGGMEAARVGELRGQKVFLWEKSRSLVETSSRHQYPNSSEITEI
jgi:2-enoate reductase